MDEPTLKTLFMKKYWQSQPNIDSLNKNLETEEKSNEN
jgi:hypothetical protein